MRRLFAAAALTALTCPAAAGSPAATWSQKYGNAQHTSSTTLTGPSRPRVVWNRHFDNQGNQGAAPVIGPDGSIYAITYTSAVALNTDGTVRWIYPAFTSGFAFNLAARSPSVSSDGKVYITTDDANGTYLTGINGSDGTVALWGPQLCSALGNSSPIYSQIGGLYIAAYDPTSSPGNANCVQLYTDAGSHVFTGSPSNGVIQGALSVNEGIYYFLDSSNLRAVNSVTGASVWDQSEFAYAVSVGADGTIYLVTNSGITARNSDGSSKWTKTISNLAARPVAIQGDTLYFSTYTQQSMRKNHFVNAVSGADGSVLWSVQVATTLAQRQPITLPGPEIGPLTIAGDTILFTLYDIRQTGSVSDSSVRAMFAVDRANGRHKWAAPLPTNNGYAGQPVPTSTRLYHFDQTDLAAFEESGVSTFTVTASTYTLAPGQSTTISATVKTSTGGAVSNVGVFFDLYDGTATPVAGWAYTNDVGVASMTFSSSSLNSSVLESTFVVRVQCLDFPNVHVPIFMEGEAIDHFALHVPTRSAIGVPFEMKVFARNKFDHALPTFPGTSGPAGVTLTPYLAGSSVAASGSLGTTVIGISDGTGTVTSQTYNEIEDISIKAAQTFPGTAYGFSSNMVISGPDRFRVSVPPVATAGTGFSMSITALDSGGNLVQGFDDLLTISALIAPATTQAGTGVLGVTSVEMSPSGVVTIPSQTYSKGENIVLRVAHAATGVVSDSTNAVTVSVPANPITHYSVTVATGVTVGLAFPMQINALDASSAPVSYSALPMSLNVAARLSGTTFSGSGSLGASAATLVAGSTFVIVSPQTYNRIETIQLRITDGDGRVGLSGPVAVGGPTTFDISVPTYTVPAGQAFRLTVVAKDGGGNQVTGYNNTVNLVAVDDADPGQTASGTLGITSIAMGAGLANTDFQTYSKGESLRVKVIDPVLNVSAVSGVFTVSAPTDNTSHYSVSAPTQVTIGLPFGLSVQSLDASSAAVTYGLSKNITLQALLSGTQVAGSGSLGLPLYTLQTGQSLSTSSVQSYNRIETVQILATDENGKTGLSAPIAFVGPASFAVTVPASTSAGAGFSLSIEARDTSGARVLGYNGSAAVSAVMSASTTTAGGGVVGITAVTFSSGAVTVSQTYTKAEAVKLKVLDTGLGISALSGTITVSAGPPAALSVAANPGSVILGQTSALTATVQDTYGNGCPNCTVTFSVTTGSGTVARDSAGLVQNLVSTTAVTAAGGQAAAVFGLPAGITQAQRNVVTATLSSLTAAATIQVSVLVSKNGGVAVQSDDPRTAVTIPANAFPYDVSVSITDRNAVTGSLSSKIDAAFAKGTAQFVAGFAKRIQAFRESSAQDAGTASLDVDLQLPYTESGGSVTVQGVAVPMVRVQSVLVPASILRVYKLNEAEELWEQVSEGAVVDTTSKVVKGKLKKVTGVYAVGAPPHQTLQGGQSGAVSTQLTGGATAQVDVPAGAFAGAASVTVDAVGSASLPTASGGGVSLRATGLALEVGAGGLQPSKPVKLTVTYTASQVAGFEESLLRLARYDETLGAWLVLDSQVDTATRRVIGYTDHFSLFQVMQIQPQATLSAAIAYPSPFRPSQGHTTITFAQLKAGAAVRLFTVSGRLLRELTADSTGVVAWDVTDRDGTAVPSGVYLAFVESGGDRKTVKFAVQR